MYQCQSGCAYDFARCSYNPLESCEPEQHITFGDKCSNGFPVIWPPQPDITPRIICKDCGCIYEMYQFLDDCFPPAPDFSEIRKHGYELQICQPNACNEIYFTFRRTRCIPPYVCCNCPICRRRRRAGDHFRDCSCSLCESRREKCLNRLRRKMIAEHSKLCWQCGARVIDIPPCCVPSPACCSEPAEEKPTEREKCAEGDEDCITSKETVREDASEALESGKRNSFLMSSTKSKASVQSFNNTKLVPSKGTKNPYESTTQRKRKMSKREGEEFLGGTHSIASQQPWQVVDGLEESHGDLVEPSTCLCHLYMPSYWEVKIPCQQRKDYEDEKVRLKNGVEEAAKAEREKKNEGVGKFLTVSLSQVYWSTGPFVPCPKRDPPSNKNNEVVSSDESETELPVPKTEAENLVESVTEATEEIEKVEESEQPGLEGQASVVQEEGEKKIESEEEEQREWEELEEDAAGSIGSGSDGSGSGSDEDAP